MSDRHSISGVLVGGYNPDEIVRKKEDEVRRQEADRIEAQRNHAKTALDHPGTHGSGSARQDTPDPEEPTWEANFSITETDEDWRISGMRYTGLPVEIHLWRSLYFSGAPKKHEFWVDHTNSVLERGAVRGGHYYCASAPFYLHLIDTLRARAAYSCSCDDETIRSQQLVQETMLIGRITGMLKSYLERNIIQTLTTVEYHRDSKEDCIFHAAGTRNQWTWIRPNLAGEMNPFTMIPEGDYLSRGLFEMPVAKVQQAIGWLQDRKDPTPYLQRFSTPPTTESMRVPLTVRIGSLGSTHTGITPPEFVADIMTPQEGTIIPIRIIRTDGKEIIR